MAHDAMAAASHRNAAWRINRNVKENGLHQYQWAASIIGSY
jgi:hypothetical protein